MKPVDKKRVLVIFGVFVVTSFMLLAGCLDNGGETKRIKLLKSGGQGMLDGFDAKTVDAMIGWEPWNANAIVDEKGYTYKNSSQIWAHHPCCSLAVDYDWYKATANADEILKRVAWVHLKTTNWINAAQPLTSPDHNTMINLAKNFTGRSDAVVEYALLNIDFDYSIDAPGIKTYAKKLEDYKIYNEQKWKDSGYASTDAYVDDVLDDQYIVWAVANAGKTSAEIALDSPVEIRFGYLTADLHQLSFWVAWKQGWFSDVNITVKESSSPQYPREFPNGGDEMKNGFKTGEIDIGFLGSAPAIIFGINENDFLETSPYYKETTIKIIAGVNYEGSAIVIRSGLKVKSMKDLEGKTLAYPGPGTVQHFLILMAAEQDGAKVQEV